MPDGGHTNVAHLILVTPQLVVKPQRAQRESTNMIKVAIVVIHAPRSLCAAIKISHKMRHSIVSLILGNTNTIYVTVCIVESCEARDSGERSHAMLTNPVLNKSAT